VNECPCGLVPLRVVERRACGRISPPEGVPTSNHRSLRVRSVRPTRTDLTRNKRSDQELVTGSPGGLTREVGTASLDRLYAFSQLAYCPFLIR
jgi:hypothetical protein